MRILILLSFALSAITNVFSQTSGEQLKRNDLSELSWMKGAWEGKAGNSSFFEAYEVKNDTLIIIRHYPDSKLANSTGEDQIFLQNGEIYHTSGKSKWKLSTTTADSWLFTPVANASNKFKWIYINPDSWKAEIISSGRVTTYPLQRIKE